MNRIVTVGDHYAALGFDGRVVGVVCQSVGSPGQWAFHPMVPDGVKTSWHYVALQMALDQAKDWAT